MKQGSMSRDLANRFPDIHWPERFSPNQADLFSHNELRIEKSCERVWKHIVEATKMAGVVSELRFVALHCSQSGTAACRQLKAKRTAGRTSRKCRDDP
jgi:hypothetical protein